MNSLDVQEDECQRTWVCALKGKTEVHWLRLRGRVSCVSPGAKAALSVAVWGTSLQLEARAGAGVLLSGFYPVAPQWCTWPAFALETS